MFLLVYFLNVLMLWTFLIDPVVLSDRVQISITCFLALVAFNFVVAEALPRISHSTYLTHFFAVNYFAFALCALESGTVFLVDKYIAPPEGYDTAKILDWTMLGVFAMFQTAVMIVFLLLSRGTIRLSAERPAHGQGMAVAAAVAAAPDSPAEKKSDSDLDVLE